ncbi:MAG: fibronectin type III domain-containing protein, partial [Holophaga sp.]|nr:fibronectin type III domain-containing protein [Holophaga sp.]
MNPTTESPTRRFLHRVLPLSLGLALLATLACGGDKAAAPPPPTPTVPVIASFAAAPAAITAGQSSTLSWSVSGHTSLAINQNVGAVTGSSQTVSPTSTLTYTLTATNATGSSTATATVTVTVTVTPVTPDTTAPSIPTGLAASTITATGLTLTWTAATDNVAVTGYRVYRGTATAPIAALTTGTTYTDTGLTASTPYTYTVVAFDAAGNASAKSSPVTATTSAVATTPVISAFTASPTTITAGGSSTLAWTVTGATSLSINNGVGTVTGSSRVVTPSATTTYTLTATNASGPVTRSAQVTVNPVGNVFHVRQSATGANNGSDWTNAFTELPSTLNRGAVYHVAD